VSYNFASGGATTDATLVTPYASTVLSLVDQVAQFTSNLSPPPSYAPWVANNTLFAIWIGVNDVGNAWYSSSWPTLSQQIVNRYFEQVETLYKAGGRNFAFLNVPPIQRAPVNLLQTDADQASIAAAVAQYNVLLQTASDAFQKNNPGSTTIVVDTQNPFNVMLDNPTVYGATNATCYDSDGTTCLWWNSYHPALEIQQLVGDTVAVDVGFYL
jgi:phospholipase/lecithinase/hemolysin